MQQKDCRISRQSRLALCMVINVPKTCPYEHPAKNAEISQLCVGVDAYCQGQIVYRLTGRIVYTFRIL